MEIPDFLKGQTQLVPGEKLLVIPVWGLQNFIFPKRQIGTIAKVTKSLESKGIAMVEIRGLSRARITKFQSLLSADCTEIIDALSEKNGMMETLRKKAQEYTFLMDINESDRLIYLMNFITSLNEMTDFISNYFISEFKNKLKLYQETDVQKRALLLVLILEKQLKNVRKIKSGIITNE